MKRDARSVYIIAAIISIVLYVSGIATGLFVQKTAIQLTEEKFRLTEEKLKSLQRRMEGIQLEYVYLSTLGRDISCSSLTALVDDSAKTVWEIGKELTELETAGTSTEQVSELTQDYYLLSVRAWILNSYVTERCVEDRVVILFFYSVPCDDCQRQGDILDQLKQEGFDEKMRVFVLNSDFQEPIVQVLKRTHNIESVPSLVIGNTTYEGLVDKDELKSIISSL